ncbi:MAG: ABC transporter substrate-binding protein [Sneathiella sp.]
MKSSKFLLASYAALFLLAGIPTISVGTASVAEATSEKKAVGLVEKLGQEAVTLLSRPDLDDHAKRIGFKSLVDRDFDMKLIGRFVLGKHWRKATKEQQTEYLVLFNDYIITTYQRRIGQYAGENLNIVKATKLNKKETLVKTLIMRPKGPSIKLDWRVRLSKSGEQRIVDMIIENISMALTHRDEFSAVVSKNNGDVEGLLAKLRDHLAKVN